LVTGGASGLGLASACRLIEDGGRVVLVDLPGSAGEEIAKELGDAARFIAADVADADQVAAAVQAAAELGPLRVLVHCAGRGGPIRVVDKTGEPGSLDAYTATIQTNLIGTFNVLRLAAAQMATNEPVDGERGVCVLTASVAAWEGQIGQIAYAASKGGVVAMTIVAARDLATRLIRVCTVAPGLFDTPLLGRLSEPVRQALAESVPHPKRLGLPEEYATLAAAIIGNQMLNGETIRLDGAIRMAAR
jgi:NAD(P)-dependent dehydrogenase (short-subunit alcohol dehydrogenase family)